MRERSIVFTATTSMQIRLLIISAFVLTFTAMAVAADDPLVGTWKLNTSKSKLAGPAPQAQTVKIEAAQNGLKFTFNWMDADGRPHHSESLQTYDGKDCPVTGDPDTDTASLKKIDNNTYVVVNKKAGKEVLKGRITVSKDGTTSTAAIKSRDSKGKAVDWVEVYDRQ
jgi:hypothetical protein